jgi:UDP-N-acetyl-D-galactosamine dehydrogenase
VAEAAKVIENTQRDINIALMNELSMIFDRMGIRTADVLAAAGTKWNFLKFRPGLVGGHCIGVDPYYLTTKAQQLGYQPEVILAGRRVNDNMGRYIGQRLVKLLVNADVAVRGARVGVLGLTFKENVTDIRNSKVPDITRELAEFGIDAIVHDPIASAQETHHEYGIELKAWSELAQLDALVVAVAHDEYLELGDKIFAPLRDGGVVIDVKSIFSPSVVERAGKHLRYWSL